MITREMHGVIVPQENQDGYINATALAKAYKQATGKRKDPSNWLRSKQAKEYIAYVASVTQICVTLLVQIKQGGNLETIEQGTWIHPKLALAYASWLSPEFQYQVTEWIEQWARGDFTRAQQPNKQQMQSFYWLARLKEFRKKTVIPQGYWSIFEETICVIADLEDFGFIAPEGMVMDISIGKCWANHLRKQKINPNELARKYHHYYPGWFHSVKANIYPNQYLGEFRDWLQLKYSPHQLPKYLENKGYLEALPAAKLLVQRYLNSVISHQ